MASNLTVGVVRETFPGEQRVALVPGLVGGLKKAGFDVLVQAGAGAAAGLSDEAYAQHQAVIVSDRAEVWRKSDVLLQVRTLGANLGAGIADLDDLKSGQVIIGLADPLAAVEPAQQIAARGAVLFALELLPRTTRAQSMDVLSSMATIAGYKAVLLAAGLLGKMFPLLMTAAGTISPARVLVIGAGVAGLQAIATARRLGASVEAYDVRPEVKEQVQSLGARFIDLPLDTASAQAAGGYAKAQDEDFYCRQRELLARSLATQDVVITTAAVFGKQAPILITQEMVQGMQAGAMIVDLAAERGGNCQLTRPDQTVTAHGVTILGPTNLPASVPFHASQMYARNVTNFLLHLSKAGRLELNDADDIVRETMICRDGRVVHPKLRAT